MCKARKVEHVLNGWGRTFLKLVAWATAQIQLLPLSFLEAAISSKKESKGVTI